MDSMNILLQLLLLSVLRVYGAQDTGDFQNGNNQVEKKTSGDKKRIVGGEKAKDNEFPFIASLKAKYVTPFCGGSILTRRHILTAAHCLADKKADEQIEVYLGQHDINNGENVQTLIANKRYPHESHFEKTEANDIAILELRQDIKFNDYVKPVCLPTKRPSSLVNQEVIGMGWGMTKDNDINSYASVLQSVKLRVVELQRCMEAYKQHGISTVNPTQICTVAPKNQDTCQGDSGGPLVYWDSQLGGYVQAALVSFGKHCGSGEPGVNTDVSAYVDWIKKKVGQYASDLNTCRET